MLTRTPSSTAAAERSIGQVLVLFALFLLLLLGVSALAIDYASWLVVDRNLQNAADHAALAGSSEFEDRSGGITCPSAKCFNARAQAWTSLSDELKIGLSSDAIIALAGSDSLPAGATTVTANGTTFNFGILRIWVTTPPPSYAAYLNAGGAYAGNNGVVFVRIDRAVTSFLGGALGIQPKPRTGWATAGALPTGLALQTFCRNNIPPQSGSCGGSGQTGLVIDGQGGIRLVSGDIGSNESIKVTASGGSGVVLDSGNAFVVSGQCSSSLWRCPNGPPSLGGISDAAGNGQNAFYMAPLPVPQYESPLDYAALSICSNTTTWDDTTSPLYHVPCVPYRNQAGTDPAPSAGQWVGDWTCDVVVNGVFVDCGTPDTSTSPPTCGGGNFDEFYRPNTDDLNNNPRWQGSPVNTNGDRYQNIRETSVDPTGALPGTVPGSAALSGSPTSWVSSQNGATNAYRVGLDGVDGVHVGGSLIVRYVLFRTVNNVPDTNPGPNVGVTVTLKERTGGGPGGLSVRGTPDVQNATNQVTVYQFAVPIASMTGSTWYNNLSLEFQVTSAQAGYGAGISWAEVEEPNLQPRQAPRIPPGYWHSITIPANKCAILDPSHATGVQQYQLPGVFRFGGGGTGSSGPRIVVNPGAYLIGDGVSLVFDPRVGSNGFPDNGIDVGTSAAMLINAGATPNAVLGTLVPPGSNAAWQVDPNDRTNPRDGGNTWPVCTRGGNECVPRVCYMNTDPDPLGICAGQTVQLIPNGRGIAFYFTPNSWTPTSVNVQRRFQMSGSGQTDAPAIAFSGVLYAPYDDVKITGRSGINTVGQVLAWTAKFNGGDAHILLEYPYTDAPAPPYLLEPTIAH